jgi:hypothetical protein
MSSGFYRVGISVTTNDANIVARAAEQFARTATGLAMEGVDTIVMIGPDTDYEPDPGDVEIG